MIEIKSLDNLTLEQLADAFCTAFADYAISFNKADLEAMLKGRGFNPRLAFGAFDNDKLVAFTFNGIGEFAGKKTAYDIGTGTVKEYRGQKLAGRIFDHSIPYLKEAGITQYLLEVLQENVGAFNIYKNIGFEVSREFYCYKNVFSKLNLNSSPDKISIKEGSSINRELMTSFQDFDPSWQNSFDAILRDIDIYKILGAYDMDGKLVGYCISEPKSGKIPHIAVDKNHRKQGIGKALLSEMKKFIETDYLKILNIQSDSEPIVKFCEAIGLETEVNQFEMIKSL